jgi:hypothetical protein
MNTKLYYNAITASYLISHIDHEFVSDLSDAEQHDLFYGTASGFYRL